MLTGEESITLAIDSLRAGAADFLLKSPSIAAVLPIVLERVCRSWDKKQESERLKERLIQSEKMSAIGLLAAGVAHEINNPIGFVMSNIGTLTNYVGVFKRILREYERLAGKIRSADGGACGTVLQEIEKVRVTEDLPYIMDDVDKLLAESMEGTERIRDIVHNLKSFARVDDAQAKEASVNEGIEATLKIVWNELKYKCKVHKKLGDVPPIRCYRDSSTRCS
jgi:signal transduction histidine kinase